MAKRAITYKSAGVDVAKAAKLVSVISGLAGRTPQAKVRTPIGGYASLFEISKTTWLAASTDGVGTKLKLAFDLSLHDTVGIDLVAMSVNDLLCVGATPLFFLDYFATGGLRPDVTKAVLRGVAEGCRQAGTALVGGETAEMPGFYRPGEYDLAGFAVGTVAPKDVLPRREVKPGDVLIGVASSGFHSNGYSLLRKLVRTTGRDRALARTLLAPTRIYAKALSGLLSDSGVKGLAHITGSGFLNVPRISKAVAYEIHLPGPGRRARVFDAVLPRTGLPLQELARTFNLGWGLVMAVSPKAAPKILKTLRARGERAEIAGQVLPLRRGESTFVRVVDAKGFMAVLTGSKV